MHPTNPNPSDRVEGNEYVNISMLGIQLLRENFFERKLGQHVTGNTLVP